MKALKLPKTVGALVDLLYTMDQQADAINTQLAEIKKQREVVESALTDALVASGQEGAKGKLAAATFAYSEVPAVQDWAILYAHIKKKGAFDLLQRRVSSTAWRERLKNGEKVPGIDAFSVRKLSVRKVPQ